MTMDVSPIAPPVYPAAPSPETSASVSTQEMQQVPTTQTDSKTATVNAQQNQGNRSTRETKQQTHKPVAEQNSHPHSFSFTYQEGERIVKVFDRQSVLIYQVPPKGRLQLLLQEHRADTLKTSA